MTQYTYKSALVTEIEKLKAELHPDFYEYNYDAAKVELLEKIEAIINTLEVKEVDLDGSLSKLDKDIKEFVTTEEFEKDSAIYGHYWAIAKYAFLLGLKTKKGE